MFWLALLRALESKAQTPSLPTKLGFEDIGTKVGCRTALLLDDAGKGDDDGTGCREWVTAVVYDQRKRDKYLLEARCLVCE